MFVVENIFKTFMCLFYPKYNLTHLFLIVTSVKCCNEKLTKAEQKVRILIQGEAGEKQEADFLQGES